MQHESEESSVRIWLWSLQRRRELELLVWEMGQSECGCTAGIACRGVDSELLGRCRIGRGGKSFLASMGSDDGTGRQEGAVDV